MSDPDIITDLSSHIPVQRKVRTFAWDLGTALTEVNRAGVQFSQMSELMACIMVALIGVSD
jgi:hypothetical protein